MKLRLDIALMKLNKLKRELPLVSLGAFFCFVAVLSVSSCQFSQQKNPSGVLQETQLVDVLTDIHLADGMISTKSFPLRFSEKDSLLYKEIFRKHGVTKTALDSSLSYYIKKQPRAFARIYEQILVRLSKMEGDLESL